MPSATWNLWEVVCQEIGVPVSERDKIKKQWTNLRDRYMKAYKTFLKYSKSGKAAKKKNAPGTTTNEESSDASKGKFKSGFIYFEQMNFLSDTADVPK